MFQVDVGGEYLTGSGGAGDTDVTDGTCCNAAVASAQVQVQLQVPASASWVDLCIIVLRSFVFSIPLFFSGRRHSPAARCRKVVRCISQHVELVLLSLP